MIAWFAVVFGINSMSNAAAPHTITSALLMLLIPNTTANHAIRESVDSLCRDGADVQYMQYLSKSHITSPQTR